MQFLTESGVRIIWNAIKDLFLDKTTANSTYVKKSGDNMTGNLNLRLAGEHMYDDISLMTSEDGHSGPSIRIQNSTTGGSYLEITSTGIRKKQGGSTIGSSQQFYATDGSVQTISTSANYLPLTGGTLTGNLKINGENKLSLGSGTQNEIALSTNSGGEFLMKFASSSNQGAILNGKMTATSFYESSDERLKNNISAISENDIQKVEKVDFKEYSFNSDPNNTKKYGVIAQDIEKVGLDNLVSENSEGMKSVDYISLLILKIQQLENRIKELEKERK